MATSIANIEWDPVAGSTGTLVEYRNIFDSTWITPSSPDNPTLLNTYPLIIDNGSQYYVRLTRMGATCSPRPLVITIQTPSSECCPATYTISPDGTYCYKIDEIAATAPTTPSTLVAVHNIAYSTCGSYIYSPGFAFNGTGTSTQITTSNVFWRNGGTCADNNTTDGPLNRAGLWVTPPLSGQDIGFAVCLNISVGKTYYVGIASDNYGIIKLNSTPILQQDPTALGIQYGVGAAATFKVWHIYPINLPSGPNIIEILGHNVSSVASMGVEIYDATSSELIAATSYVDLGAKLIFSSKDYVGQDAQLGSGGVGYSCPSGYSLSVCSEPIVCRRIITTSTISC